MITIKTNITHVSDMFVDGAVYTSHSWESQAFVLQQLCTQQVICINILCSGRENRKQTPFFKPPTVRGNHSHGEVRFSYLHHF